MPKKQNAPKLTAPQIIEGVTVSELAAVFTEWHKRWKLDPAKFQTDAQKLSRPSDSYGDSAAPYFANILNELRNP
ncbi:MAG TPA: hypothetical protein VH619_05060 [Verrucomicrobiae bacterium]|nr:hypothetical protein [Verrucomicrobiae bacterium]